MIRETGRRLHNMTQIPKGKSVADILPAFSDVKHKVYVGKPNKQCASCRKPFNAVRKPRQKILMYPMRTILPICFSFDICGPCYAGIKPAARIVTPCWRP